MDAIAYAKASSAYKLAKLVETELTNKVNLSESSIIVPVGTTATRPTLGAGESALRYNSDVGGLEEWTGIKWRNVSADISAITLKGTDTEVNILAKVGMVAEDLWIASDTLDGWVYDGLAWINIGLLQGPQGVQGIQGIQGIQGEVGPQGIQGIQGEIGHQGIQGIQGIQGETGAKGDNGDTGAQGIQGIQGEIGLQGPQGLIGETGLQGPIGETGAGLVVKGTDTVAIILLKSGVEGDFWIASDTGDGYSYVSGSWVNTGQIRGPQGEQGDQGTQGETGPQGVTGNGIASIVKTGTVGLVDTYTVTMTSGATATLTVTNGLDGVDGLDVDHIAQTSGTGAAGTVDVYTVWGDVAETVNLGTFNVYNGLNGTGIVNSVVAGANVTVDNTDPTSPIVGLGTNVTVQGNTFNGAEQLVKLGIDGKLPAIDGSNLTNMAVAVASVAGKVGSVVLDTADVVGLDTALSSKQDTLVSGTNIKTINGDSILGSGNIVLTATSDFASITGKPTTLDGYGITDAYTKTESNSSLALKVDKVSGKGLSTEDYTSIEKTKLAGIAASANNYSLPIATNTVLGGVKAGANVSIDAAGVISASSSGGTPAGTIITVAKNTAPTEYLKANGALVSRTTYSALFAAIGTTFGAGDGSTTFALPDLRGYFPRGWDDGRGIDTGRVFGSLQADAYLNHSHTASETSAGAHTHNIAASINAGANDFGVNISANSVTPGVGGLANTSSAGEHTHTITVAASTTGATETRPKNIALLYCIKY